MGIVADGYGSDFDISDVPLEELVNNQSLRELREFQVDVTPSLIEIRKSEYLRTLLGYTLAITAPFTIGASITMVPGISSFEVVAFSLGSVAIGSIVGNRRGRRTNKLTRLAQRMSLEEGNEDKKYHQTFKSFVATMVSEGTLDTENKYFSEELTYTQRNAFVLDIARAGFLAGDLELAVQAQNYLRKNPSRDGTYIEVDNEVIRMFERMVDDYVKDGSPVNLDRLRQVLNLELDGVDFDTYGNAIVALIPEDKEEEEDIALGLEIARSKPLLSPSLEYAFDRIEDRDAIREYGSELIDIVRKIIVSPNASIYRDKLAQKFLSYASQEETADDIIAELKNATDIYEGSRNHDTRTFRTLALGTLTERINYFGMEKEFDEAEKLLERADRIIISPEVAPIPLLPLIEHGNYLMKLASFANGEKKEELAGKAEELYKKGELDKDAIARKQQKLGLHEKALETFFAAGTPS